MSLIKRALSSVVGRSKRAAPFTIPVLCYHSWRLKGPLYPENDHVALAQDLRVLAERGYEIIPLPALVRLLQGEQGSQNLANKKLVGISFDDGNRFDYFDHESDAAGTSVSFTRLMTQSADYLPQAIAGPRAVSFVIASPTCRSVLGGEEEQFCDKWWEPCAAAGAVGIANHSWDHVHDAMDCVEQKDNLKGSFFEINTFNDAERQIAQAHSFIAERTFGRALPLFGYPYGHVPPYLRDEYFPQHAQRIGICAAFSTGGAPVTQNSNLWDIPRYVCGEHWRSPSEFTQILTTLESTPPGTQDEQR